MKADSAIILAGGKSSRMGFDKQLIKIGDKLIVDYLAERLKRHFREIIVVTNRQDLYCDKDYILKRDIFFGLGPMAGIHAGLLEISSDAAFVIACDMPNVNDDFLEYLKKLFEEKEVDGIISVAGDFIEPMNGIYGKNIVDCLETCLKKRELKLKIAIDRLNFIKLDKNNLRAFDKDLKFFDNINYRRDLERIENIYRQ